MTSPIPMVPLGTRPLRYFTQTADTRQDGETRSAMPSRGGWVGVGVGANGSEVSQSYRR